MRTLQDPSRLSRAADLLPRLLAGSGRAAIGTIDWESVLDLALRHGIAALLQRRLITADIEVPDAVVARLADERRTTALVNLRHYGEFRRIVHAFRPHAIPVIALKGLHLAELVYQDISLRPMSDVDILVPRDRVADAVAALRRMGYGFDVELSGAVEAMLDAKCNVGLWHREHRIWLEVHWALNEPPSRTAEAVAEIWRDAVEGSIGDAPVRVMPDEHLLLHVCAHLACNHGFAFSLRALCDIAEIVNRRPELDWDLVHARSRAYGCSRGVAAALRLASEHLAAAIPRSALAAAGSLALDPHHLAEAMDHLVSCVDIPPAIRTAPNLIAATSQKPSRKSVGLLLRRIFPGRTELALLYGIPEASRRLPLYYFVRLRDLLRRYAAGAWALLFSDPALAAAARRHARLLEWVDEPRSGGLDAQSTSSTRLKT